MSLVLEVHLVHPLKWLWIGNPCDGIQQRPPPERLRQIRGRAAAYGLVAHTRGVMRGDHDHRRPPVAEADFIEQIETRHCWQLEIADHASDAGTVAGCEQRLGGGIGSAFKTRCVQQAFNRFPHSVVVLDHDYPPAFDHRHRPLNLEPAFRRDRRIVAPARLRNNWTKGKDICPKGQFGLAGPLKQYQSGRRVPKLLCQSPEFRCRLHAELFHQLRALRLDRAFTGSKLIGNLLVELAGHHTIEDLALAGRE